MGLYFIVRGEVEFMLEDNIPIFKRGVYIIKRKSNNLIYQPGESFGEVSFMSGKTQEFTARSTQLTNIAFIPLDIFLDLLSKYPNDKVRFKN